MTIRLRTKQKGSHTNNRSLKSLAAIFFILEELEQKHRMVSWPKGRHLSIAKCGVTPK